MINHVHVCDFCGKPIGGIGEYDFVTVSGCVYHHNCYSELKEVI